MEPIREYDDESDEIACAYDAADMILLADGTLFTKKGIARYEALYGPFPERLLPK